MLTFTLEWLLEIAIILFGFAAGVYIAIVVAKKLEERKHVRETAKACKEKFKLLFDNDKNMFPALTDEEAMNILSELMNPDNKVIMNYSGSRSNAVAEYIGFLIQQIEKHPSAWKNFHV